MNFFALRNLKKKFLFIFSVLLGFLGCLTLGFIFLCIYPIKTDSLISYPQPSKSFEESLKRISLLNESNSEELLEEGHSILIHHGKKVERVIVFFHGFTNSPRQFKLLAEEFYKLGYNVYIPRIPYHGLKPSNASELSKLTAEDLVLLCDQAVDIAQGLGDHVTVAGLSMGGIMAGWAAQFRSDIDFAVLMAPNFGNHRYSEIFLKPGINIMLLTSNHFIWWDSKLKNQMSRPATAYFGFYSRALGEVRRLGWDVLAVGRNTKPKTNSILVITNANDQAVSKAGTDNVVKHWSRFQDLQLKRYIFPKALNLPHDFIDPQQPTQNISITYPKLLTLIINQDAQ